MTLTRETVEKLMADATPGPWMVAGVRGKLDHQAVHNVFRYDADKKRDEQIAAVWYDVKTGLGHTDARLIASAPDLATALLAAWDELAERDAENARLRDALDSVANYMPDENDNPLVVIVRMAGLARTALNKEPKP